MPLRISNRRFVGLLSALLFAWSTLAHGFVVTELSMAADSMAMQMSMDMPSADASGHPMKCDGKDQASRAACNAVCATAVGMTCEFVRMSFLSVSADLVAAPQQASLGIPIPPEPHPPRPAMLG